MKKDKAQTKATPLTAVEMQRGVKWRCEWCGDGLTDEQVETYGDGYCHVVAVQDRFGEPEPAPCGPVNKIAT